MRARLRESRHDAAGLQLREEAGGETGVPAQLHQTHGLLEPQPLDPLADVLFGDEPFGGFGIHLRLLGLFSANRSGFSHQATLRGAGRTLLP